MAHRRRTSFANRGTAAVVLPLRLPAVLLTSAPAALVRTALGLALANHQTSPERHLNGSVLPKYFRPGGPAWLDSLENRCRLA